VNGYHDVNRVLAEAVLLQCLDDLTGAPVKLDDCIAARALAGLICKARVWHAWNVVIVQRKVQEERFVLVGLDKTHRFFREIVGHVFIVPQCRFAAGHVADATDAVDDRLIVAVSPIHDEFVTILHAVKFAWEIFLAVADFDRVAGVKVEDVTISNVDAGHSVAAMMNESSKPMSLGVGWMSVSSRTMRRWTLAGTHFRAMDGTASRGAGRLILQDDSAGRDARNQRQHHQEIILVAEDNADHGKLFLDFQEWDQQPLVARPSVFSNTARVPLHNPI